MTDVWDELHDKYADSDWIDQPSIFAKLTATYFPDKARVLDLGGGEGQDSRYFASLSHPVVLTDIAAGALTAGASKLTDFQKSLVTTEVLDLIKPFPFPDASFGVVYAHLSLHYFPRKTTQHIFDQIHRVLEPDGILAFLVNSVTDPEYNTGTLLEPDYFLVDKTAKRYFSVATAKAYARQFKPILLDNLGETYKDQAKGTHNLIRFIGQKS